MGRFKTTKERELKKEIKLTDEEKEAMEWDKETYNMIREVPGWTGDHAEDQKNPGIQKIINRRYQRQKV